MEIPIAGVSPAMQELSLPASKTGSNARGYALGRKVEERRLAVFGLC
ncbi:hypothetical protein [Shinella zoogloeoides]|jgi:hypothetical protein|nr:hypothetical protein [Shinella zoogloeoides]